jgi:hypothetical protein
MRSMVEGASGTEMQRFPDCPPSSRKRSGRRQIPVPPPPPFGRSPSPATRRYAGEDESLVAWTLTPPRIALRFIRAQDFLLIPEAEQSLASGIHNPGLSVWIPGSPRSLSSGGAKRRPGGDAPE